MIDREGFSGDGRIPDQKRFVPLNFLWNVARNRQKNGVNV